MPRRAYVAGYSFSSTPRPRRLPDYFPRDCRCLYQQIRSGVPICSYVQPSTTTVHQGDLLAMPSRCGTWAWRIQSTSAEYTGSADNLRLHPHLRHAGLGTCTTPSYQEQDRSSATKRQHGTRHHMDSATHGEGDRLQAPVITESAATIATRPIRTWPITPQP